MKNQIFSILLFLLSSFTVKSQEEEKVPKNIFEVNFSTKLEYSILGVNYQRHIWTSQSQKINTGLGIGLRATTYKPFSTAMLPVSLYIEYGKKHVVGLNTGLSYFAFIKSYLLEIPSIGEINSNLYFDYYSYFFTAYYKYHFGAEEKYFIGTHIQWHNFFGELYGKEVGFANQIYLGLNLGLRF